MTLSVRPQYLVALAVALVALCWWRISTAAEREIRRSLREVAEIAEKQSASENPVFSAYGAARLTKLLAPTVSLAAPETGDIPWRSSRSELVRDAFTARARASSLSLKLGYPSIRFPAAGEAVATLKAQLEGDFPEFNGSFSDARPVEVVFHRDVTSGRWLLQSVRTGHRESNRQTGRSQ